MPAQPRSRTLPQRRPLAMISVSPSPRRTLSPRKHAPYLRPKASSSKPSSSTTITPPILPPPSRATAALAHLTNNIKKPMRPLTAYHIFFQIEREYVIQTTPGAVADASMHDGKSKRDDVPRRYRTIRLLPDWYAGPGKRKKRKHRKSHGKIGFLELSKVVSERWATLGDVDPETLEFVKKVAARELDEYKEEMVRYKALTEGEGEDAPHAAGVAAEAAATVVVSPKAASPKASSSSSSSGAGASSSRAGRRRPAKGGAPPAMPRLRKSISPAAASSSRDLRPAAVSSSSSSSSSSSVPPAMSQRQQSVPRAEPVSSSNVSVGGDEDDEIDYSICSLGRNGNYIPSPPRRDSSGRGGHVIYDPLFELDDGCHWQQQQQQQPTGKSQVETYIPSTPASSSPRRGSLGSFINADGALCDPLFELDDGFDFKFQQQSPAAEKRCVSPMSSDGSMDQTLDIIGSGAPFGYCHDCL